jgi:excisionase family DNA binding protein
MTGEPAPQRLTYSVEEAAELLGISCAFAYECVNRGEIPHLRIGRRILIPRSALHKFVEGATTSEPATE